jgi:uncharacterized protein
MTRTLQGPATRMTPTLQGPATRITIYVGDNDRSHHTSVARKIVRRAHDQGLAGASMLHGIEGYGAHGFVHTERFPDSADGLPTVVIIVVDTDDKLRAFIPVLDELIAEGLVTLDPVEGVRYIGATPAP